MNRQERKASNEWQRKNMTRHSRPTAGQSRWRSDLGFAPRVIKGNEIDMSASPRSIRLFQDIFTSQNRQCDDGMNTRTHA